MARLTHSQLVTLAGFEMLPPTLLVLLGHPWLGAAALGAVLAMSTLRSWMLVRSERDWQRAVLAYAQDNIYLGRDPTQMVEALQAAASGVAGEPQQRGYDQRGQRRDRTW